MSTTFKKKILIISILGLGMMQSSYATNNPVPINNTYNGTAGVINPNVQNALQNSNNQNNNRGYYRYNYNYNCYKSINGSCITKSEYQRYLNYANNTIARMQQYDARLQQEYRYNNGRLRLLPNGRYLAKENDPEFVKRETVCSEADFFLRGKTSCNTCDRGYQNTMQGGYGGGTAYNNSIGCSVVSKQNSSGLNINLSDYNPFGAVAGAAAGAIFGGKNNNNTGGSSSSGGGGSAGGGMSMGGGGNMATQAFACLEYYTNSNGMMNGGDHLKYSTNMQYCQQPMSYYYNNLEVYYCTQAGCYYNSPATIQVRKMWLYTNPYIFIGNTMSESDRIAQQRTNTSTYGSWKQPYIYPM